MQVPAVIKKLLDEVAQKERFSTYKFELKSASKPGEGYQSEMISVKLIGDRVEDGVASSETLNLMCKIAPESKERRKTFKMLVLFEREIHMYTHVLPAFVKFQQEKGLPADESFLSFPKLYAASAGGVDDSYALILEDLSFRDFETWPKQDPITLRHEEIFFEQLGRFHGVSFAMKDQRPEVFAEFKNLDNVLCKWLDTRFMQNSMPEAIERAINVLENEKHKEVVKGFRNGRYLDAWKSMFSKEAAEKFGVVGHGDCWINNFMFQYAGNKKEVKDISFVDWQISRYASPVLDVLYHFFQSTRKPLRDQSYDDLLKVYYDSLSDTIRKLGSDPEKLFRFSDLLSELKANGKFVLIMAVFLLPYQVAHPDDITDMQEYAERLLLGENISIFQTDGTGNDVYIKAMNEVVGDVISYGYDH